MPQSLDRAGTVDLGGLSKGQSLHLDDLQLGQGVRPVITGTEPYFARSVTVWWAKVRAMMPST